MPGICGIVTAETVTDLAGILEGMLDEMKHAAWYRVEQTVDPTSRVGLGRVSLGFVNRGVQPAADPDAGIIVVLDGELYNADACRRSLESAGVTFSGESPAELLLRGYQAEGRRFLPKLNGRFSAAIWDGGNGRLILTNDAFGMKPLYYAAVGGKLVFASEIKSILVDGDVPRERNPRGFAQFLTYGHLWGDDTLYEAVRALPPAAWLTFQPGDARPAVDRYWRLQPPADSSLSRGEMLDRIDAALKSAVDLRTEGDGRLGLALSGGLDARTILGLVDHDRIPMQCVSIGMEGSLDQRSARRLSELAGYPYHTYVLSDGFLSRFAEHLHHMVRLTDGHYLSQCIVMPTLPYYRELGIEVLLRGHAGELMHLHKAYNFSLDRQALQLTGGRNLENWLFQHLRAYMLEGLDQPLLQFADDREVEGMARESLADSLKESEGWSLAVNRISHLFVSQRMRRETAMSLVKFGSVVETRLPYIDATLIETLLGASPELRYGDDVQTHILRKRRPAFLKPPNSNTGASVGAGPLNRTFHFAKMKVLAKLGVAGYQPYERLGLWLRRELRPQVQDLLLNDVCLERGIFRPDTVRRVVDQHLNNQRNHTFLLLAMMILEAGQRQFVDSRKEIGSSRAASPAHLNAR